MGGTDHLAPGIELNLDALSELLGRAFDLIEVERLQALTHVRLADELDDSVVNCGDDLLWRSGRHKNSQPLISFQDRIASLGDGWNVGQLLRTHLAGQRE